MRNVEHRRSLLVEVDGRMVATHIPADRHGFRNTYKYWLCRCVPCTDAAMSKPDPASDQSKYLLGEYAHMRSFGMCHERACARVGVSLEWMGKLLAVEAVPA